MLDVLVQLNPESRPMLLEPAGRWPLPNDRLSKYARDGFFFKNFEIV